MKMKILIDAMGGDNAPSEIIKGARLAAEDFADKANIALVGRKGDIEKCAANLGVSLDGIEIHYADDVIGMEEPPLSVKNRPDSSLRVGFDLLNSGAVDAFVSAGSTGAIHTGATLFVRRIPGVIRSAIAAVIPLTSPFMLIDSGANSVVTEEHLLQFAKMGSIYMNNIFGIERPRVGLLNIGAEDHKGTPMHVAAYAKLSECSSIDFIGNVEGKDVPFGVCDVLVCDGFNGNILLKTIEGMSSFLLKQVKRVFMTNGMTKLASVVCKKPLMKLKGDFDASEHGGAPMLGIAKPVIKAHGSSDARAIRSAVRQAIAYAETGIIGKIAEAHVKEGDNETA